MRIALGGRDFVSSLLEKAWAVVGTAHLPPSTPLWPLVRKHGLHGLATFRWGLIIANDDSSTAQALAETLLILPPLLSCTCELQTHKSPHFPVML